MYSTAAWGEIWQSITAPITVSPVSGIRGLVGGSAPLAQQERQDSVTRSRRDESSEQYDAGHLHGCGQNRFITAHADPLLWNVKPSDDSVLRGGAWDGVHRGNAASSSLGLSRAAEEDRPTARALGCDGQHNAIRRGGARIPRDDVGGVGGLGPWIGDTNPLPAVAGDQSVRCNMALLWPFYVMPHPPPPLLVVSMSGRTAGRQVGWRGGCAVLHRCPSHDSDSDDPTREQEQGASLSHLTHRVGSPSIPMAAAQQRERRATLALPAAAAYTDRLHMFAACRTASGGWAFGWRGGRKMAKRRAIAGFLNQATRYRAGCCASGERK